MGNWKSHCSGPSLEISEGLHVFLKGVIIEDTDILNVS